MVQREIVVVERMKISLPSELFYDIILVYNAGEVVDIYRELENIRMAHSTYFQCVP